jgi:aminopeptidase N
MLADSGPAMRPAFVGDIATNAGLPRYDLKLWIDPAEGVLTGTEQILFPNRTGAPLDQVALRLYPNFPRDVFGKGGDVRMDVTDASIDGQPAEIRYAAQRTAVLLPFAQPLGHERSATLVVSFTATIKPSDDGAWPLPSYYPMLAVYDGGSWRLDVTHFADHVYAQSAFYAVEITAPANLSVVASGTTVENRARGDGHTTHFIRSGPVREFALTVGDFVATHGAAGTGDEVAVNVYVVRHSRLDAQQIARVASSALANFERRFGPYPYRELDIHLLPGDYDGGDEYPGLILLYSDGQVDAGTRYVAAHEVAHQWWYGVVGNDIYRQPWLDEAFAQYSAIIYDEDSVGPAVARADWEREVMRRYRGALADGDLPIGRAIDGYPNFNVYYRTVYGKGAVFLRMVRAQLGDETFFKALQAYYHRHRYGIATTRDVQRAFEQASGRDLGALFRQWVIGRE